MYYITNQTDQVIAADNVLLELLNVETIEELSKQIIFGNIHFEKLTEEKIKISTEANTFSFETHTATLSSLVGNLNLVSLKQEISEEKSFPEDTSISIMEETPLEKELPLTEELITKPDLESEDDLIFIKEEEPPSELITPEEPELSLESPIDLLDVPEVSEQVTETKTEISEDELFELTIPQAPEDTIEEIQQTKTEEIPSQEDAFILEEVAEETPVEKDDTSPIVIDITAISQSIGISTDDYKVFLNEYIDTAIALEDDLKSDDAQKRASAISSLTQLSEVLQLPHVNQIMSNVALETSTDKERTIASFYNVLSRLVTTETSAVTPEPELVSEPPVLEEEKTELDTQVPSQDESKGFGTIDLSNVQPIHFDFQLEEAANDLSLPVELIEEFVHDFIDQAHTETQKMLVAHEEGNLKRIQEIGHMLKGASSNLRINPLSDTLYEIQFCEDSSKLDGLIKYYWGHFLSFEQQINILSK